MSNFQPLEVVSRGSETQLQVAGNLNKLAWQDKGLYHPILGSSSQGGYKNEMNRVLGRLCAHIGRTGPGEPPEDGEMNEMTLPSKHRTRNSSPGGPRPSTLLLGHGGSPQYCVSHVDGEETFCFFQTAETGNRTPNSSVKGSGANHHPRAPAQGGYKHQMTYSGLSGSF